MGLFELFYFEISFCLGERQLWDCGCCELANQGIVKLDCLLKKKEIGCDILPFVSFIGDIKVILDSFAIALNRLWTLLSSTTNILTRSTGVEQRGNPSGEPFLHHLSNTNQHKVNIHSYIAICSVATTPESTCLVLAGLAEVLRLHRPLVYMNSPSVGWVVQQSLVLDLATLSRCTPRF